MSFNGSGTFVINTAGQPVVPNTVISSTAFNALTADLANGLSTCITKDGQTTPTANIPMGNNKITGLAAGTAGTDAANLSQVQGSTAKLLQSVTGTDTITAAMIPALTTYTAGQMFYFVAAGNNTGPVTINIDSLGAKSVTRDGSTALVSGDIVSGEIALIVYDGTRFQLLNGNSFTNLNVSNNLTLSGSTANGVLYLNGSKVATSGSALTFDGSTLGIATTAGNMAQLNSTAANGGFLTFQRSGVSRGFIGSAAQLSGGSNDDFTVRAESNLVFSIIATEGMRLTSTGLGIGTASPGKKLDVSGTVRATVDTGSAAAIDLTYSSSTRTIHALETGGGNARPLRILAQSLTYADDSATRLTVDTSGNLGIGTASPDNKLEVAVGDNAGINIEQTGASQTGYLNFRDSDGALEGRISYDHSNNSLRFATSQTERARITAGGYFKASNTGTYDNSTSSQHEFYQTDNSNALRITSTSSAVSGAYGLYVDLTADPNATDSFFIRCYGGANQRASIRSNGGLANYQTNDVNLSDERVKTDIAPLGSMWAKIKALEIVTFKYKDQTHDDDNIGLIAQQVEAVAPEFVDADGWGETPEDGVPLKSIYTADMYHAAIKALQEAMARIESLEADVAALKGAK